MHMFAHMYGTGGAFAIQWLFFSKPLYICMKNCIIEKKSYETEKKVWNMDYSSTAYGI